jgi:hypothetical protein
MLKADSRGCTQMKSGVMGQNCVDLLVEQALG